LPARSSAAMRISVSSPGPSIPSEASRSSARPLGPPGRSAPPGSRLRYACRSRSLSRRNFYQRDATV
jgi:hypothetical protein